MMYIGWYLAIGLIYPFVAGVIMLIRLIRKYGSDLLTWYGEEIQPNMEIDVRPINLVYTLIAWPVVVTLRQARMYEDLCIQYEEYKTFFK